MAKVTSLFLLSMAFLATCSLAAESSEADPLADFKDDVLTQLNESRAQYGAKSLTWSDALYPETLQWANDCKFGHSQADGKYGETIYAAGGDYVTFSQGLKAWMYQAQYYRYSKPAYNLMAADFTQVVWKGTTEVACAMADCDPDTISTKYIVCRYSPAGNIEGQFPQNVGFRVY